MLAQPVIQQQLEQPLEHHPVAMARKHGQQTDLANPAAGRQVTVDVAELFVERERSFVPYRHHADELVAIQRDEIGVLVVETVHQPLLRVRRVLGDFLDEGFVIETENLLELRFSGGHFKSQGLLRVHGCRGTARLSLLSFRPVMSLCISSGIFLRCAIKISSAKADTPKTLVNE